MKTKAIPIEELLNDHSIQLALKNFFKNYWPDKEWIDSPEENAKIVKIGFYENICIDAPLNVECVILESNIKHKPVLIAKKNKNGKKYYTKLSCKNKKE